MRSKKSGIDNQALGLPESRMRAHLFGSPTVTEFYEAVTTGRARLLRVIP
jgi:hypothetical protein